MSQRIDVKRQSVEYSKSVEVNNWISKNCKEANKGLNVQDIDFMFCEWKNNPKSVMFVELKQFGGKVKPGQYAQFSIVDKAFNKYRKDGFADYRGFFAIVLSDESPDNSKEILLKKLFQPFQLDFELEIDREQLRQFLNFEITFEELLKRGIV